MTSPQSKEPKDGCNRCGEIFPAGAHHVCKGSEELDEILINLDAYKLNRGGVMGGVDFSVEEHYAMYPELKAAKAALMKWLSNKEREARSETVAKYEALLDNPENNYNSISDTVIILIDGAKMREFKQG